MSINSSYNNIILLNIGGNPIQGEALKKRVQLNEKGKDVIFTVINIKPEDLNKEATAEELEQFSKINNLSKVYILDHGAPDANHTGSGVHYSNLAEWMAKRLKNNSIKYINSDNPENNNLQKKILRISLLLCHGGYGENHDGNSFGSKLHNELTSVHNIQSELIARKRFTYTGSMTEKNGKLTSEEYYPTMADWAGKDLSAYHQVPGSKVIFKWDAEGNQLRKDAYIHSISENLGVALQKLEEIVPQLNLDSICEEDIRVLKNMAEELSHNNIQEFAEGFEGLNQVLRNKHRRLNLYLDAISKEMDRSKAIVSNSSNKTKMTGRISEKYESINEEIVRKLHRPLLDELLKMERDEERTDRPVKITSQDFLKILSSRARVKAESDMPFSTEMNFVEMMTNCLKRINQAEFSQVDLERLEVGVSTVFSLMSKEMESFTKKRAKTQDLEEIETYTWKIDEIKSYRHSFKLFADAVVKYAKETRLK